MTTQPTIDQAKTEAFLGKVLSDTSGMTTTILASIGDRLGLFTHLAHGPATSTELANRAEIYERYAREWLGAMASAGYVVYDPANERFTLPAEHLPVLEQENGPFFFGGHAPDVSRHGRTPQPTRAGIPARRRRPAVRLRSQHVGWVRALHRGLV